MHPLQSRQKKNSGQNPDWLDPPIHGWSKGTKSDKDHNCGSTEKWPWALLINSKIKIEYDKGGKYKDIEIITMQTLDINPSIFPRVQFTQTIFWKCFWNLYFGYDSKFDAGRCCNEHSKHFWFCNKIVLLMFSVLVHHKTVPSPINENQLVMNIVCAYVFLVMISIYVFS